MIYADFSAKNKERCLVQIVHKAKHLSAVLAAPQLFAKAIENIIS